MITIQDTIKKAISIKGLEILLDKKKLCLLLEDLSPTLKEEREFIEKIYDDSVGKIIYHIYLANNEQKKEYLRDAHTYLEEKRGYNEKWRQKFLGYFTTEIKTNHKVSLRILSQGEDRRNVDIFPGEARSGLEISKNLWDGPLFRICYNENLKKAEIENTSFKIWTIIFPNFEKKELEPGGILALEKDMMIRIVPRVAQLNVIDVE